MVWWSFFCIFLVVLGDVGTRQHVAQWAEMRCVNLLAGANGYNPSEIDGMALTDTLAEDALYSFTPVKCFGAGGWINWGVKRLSKEPVCRSSAFMQGFKACLIRFSLPDRKLLFHGEYEILARFRVWLSWVLIQKCCFRCLKSKQQKSVCSHCSWLQWFIVLRLNSPLFLQMRNVLQDECC